MRRNGMTLVEILVAIAIIAILLSIGVYVGNAVYEQAKERAVESTFVILESALDEYKEYEGDFPEATDADPVVNSEILYGKLNGLPVSRKMLEKLNASLICDEDSDGNPEICDPWGTVLDYWYEQGVNHYPEIVSGGPDKNVFKKDDNISSKDK